MLQVLATVQGRHLGISQAVGLYVSAITKKTPLDFVLVLDAFLVFISKSPLCKKFIETKKWQYRATNSVLPQIKAI